MAPAAVTASPSPVTTEELLSGMVTEEVEPGVLRIRGRCHQAPRCARPGHQSHRQGLAVQGPRHVRARAGGRRDPVSTASSRGPGPTWPSRPSGILWAKRDAHQDEGTLASFDGQGWTEHSLPDGSPIGAIEAMPDGAVLVTEHVEDGPGPLVARLDDDGWTMLPTLDDPDLAGSYRGEAGYLAAAPDGSVWLSNGRLHDGGPTNSTSPQGLLHYDGDRWQSVEPMPDTPSMRAGPVAVGPDGTLWVYMLGEGEQGELPRPLGRRYLEHLLEGRRRPYAGLAAGLGVTLRGRWRRHAVDALPGRQ